MLHISSIYTRKKERRARGATERGDHPREAQILSADPKSRETAATENPAANDGDRDPTEEVGAGAGASAATEAPMREKTVTSTAVRASSEAAELETAIDISLPTRLWRFGQRPGYPGSCPDKQPGSAAMTFKDPLHEIRCDVRSPKSGGVSPTSRPVGPSDASVGQDASRLDG
nr:hypothetical protein DM860_007657 [Ipomoea batatas]GMD48841.1 hypothetical protein DM860_007657 [Ipomoea batatas]